MYLTRLRSHVLQHIERRISCRCSLANMGREKVVAAEMMDYQSLKAVQTLDNVPDFVREVPEGTSAILFQLKAIPKTLLMKTWLSLKNN